MRAINHSLTGAIIGLTVADPLVAVPLALVSHYVLDTIPHYGEGNGQAGIVKRSFIYLLIADAVLCLALVCLLAIRRPEHWLLAIICAFVAASPDFLSINLFYRTMKKLPWSPGRYIKFARGIQWFERPIGIVVELVWLVSFIFCLAILLRK